MSITPFLIRSFLIAFYQTEKNVNIFLNYKNCTVNTQSNIKHSSNSKVFFYKTASQSKPLGRNVI